MKFVRLTHEILHNFLDDGNLIETFHIVKGLNENDKLVSAEVGDWGLDLFFNDGKDEVVESEIVCVRNGRLSI